MQCVALKECDATGIMLFTTCICGGIACESGKKCEFDECEDVKVTVCRVFNNVLPEMCFCMHDTELCREGNICSSVTGSCEVPELCESPHDTIITIACLCTPNAELCPVGASCNIDGSCNLPINNATSQECGETRCASFESCVNGVCIAKCVTINSALTTQCDCEGEICGSNVETHYCALSGCMEISLCEDSVTPLFVPCKYEGVICETGSVFDYGECQCSNLGIFSSSCECGSATCTSKEKCNSDFTCSSPSLCGEGILVLELCTCGSFICTPGQTCNGTSCIDSYYCPLQEEALEAACICFEEHNLCGAGEYCGSSQICAVYVPPTPTTDYLSSMWTHDDGYFPRLIEIINANIGIENDIILGSGYYENTDVVEFLSNEDDHMPYPSWLPNFFRFHGRGAETNPFSPHVCYEENANDSICTEGPIKTECFKECQEYVAGECVKPYCHGVCLDGECVCKYDEAMPDGEIRLVDYLDGLFCEAILCTCLLGEECYFDSGRQFHLCRTNTSDPLNDVGFDDVCNSGCNNASSFDCEKRKCSKHAACFGQECIGQVSGEYRFELANFFQSVHPEIGECFDRINGNAHNFNNTEKISLDFTCLSCIQPEASGWSCDICADYSTHLNANGKCVERIDLPNWCYKTQLIMANLSQSEIERHHNSINGVELDEDNENSPTIHRNFTIRPDKLNDGHFCFACEANDLLIYTLIDNLCYLKCTDGQCSYGECYYLNRNLEVAGSIESNNYFCLDDSCVCDAYNAANVCVSSKKMGWDYSERKKCVVELDDPNGFCYSVDGYHRCLCNNATYNGTDMLTPEYYYRMKSCYEGCQTTPNFSPNLPVCWFGQCFLEENRLDYFCEKCTVNATGDRCTVCEVGQVEDNHTCYTEVNAPHGCYNNTVLNDPCYCVECAGNFILIKHKCVERCFDGDCGNGDCYYLDSTKTKYNCSSCFDGYTGITSPDDIFKCVGNTDNYYGDCYINGNGITVCKCYPGFEGPQCEEFNGITINDTAFMRDNTYNGECYYNYLDHSIVVCLSCNQGYSLPLCKYCAIGYEMTANGKCASCSPGYERSGAIDNPALISKLGSNACVSKILNYQRGVCYYFEDEIICTSCFSGYDLNQNCDTCLVGYFRVGSICVEGNSECGQANIEGIVQEVCPGCEKGMDEQCTGCYSNEIEFNGSCVPRAQVVSGNCAMLNGSIACFDENYCLEGVANSTDPLRIDCRKCSLGYHTANGSCHQRLQIDGIYYHGECYEEILYDHTTSCVTCDNGWTGYSCHKCASGTTYCACDSTEISQCCCKLINAKAGICFNDYTGQKRCVQCFRGYSLTLGLCIKNKSSPLYLLWVGLLLLIIAVIIVLIVYYYRLSSFQKFRLKRRVKFALKSAGIYVLYTVLAEICSLIMAIEDVYIDSISFQFGVIFYASIPFAILFLAFQFPKRHHFFLKSRYDIFKFVVAVATDIVFNYLLYYGIPDELGVGEAIFKAMVAPACLLCFVFFARYRFTQPEIWFALSAAIVPTIYELYSSISSSTTPGFFEGLDASAIILGVLFIVCDVVVLTLEMYIFEIVLNIYDEIEALLLVSTFEFLLYGAVLLFYIPNELPIITDGGFMLCILTQVLENVLQIFIMAGISSTEFSINCVSSAVWVEMISAIGTLVVARNSGVIVGSGNVVVTVLVFIFVIASLVAFSEAHNPMLRGGDDEADEIEDNGVQTVLLKKKNPESSSPFISSLHIVEMLEGLFKKIVVNKESFKKEKEKETMQERSEPREMAMEELLVTLASSQNYVFKPVRSNGRVISVDVNREDNLLAPE